MEPDEVLDEAGVADRVGPRDGERHLVRRVDTAGRDAGEFLELGPIAQPELETGCTETEGAERRDVGHGSSLCG